MIVKTQDMLKQVSGDYCNQAGCQSDHRLRQRAAAFIHAANSPRIFVGPLRPSGENMPQVALPPATLPKDLT